MHPRTPVPNQPLSDTPTQAAKRRSFSLLLTFVLVLPGCGPDRDPEAQHSGPELAQRYCQGCHMLPEPDRLDRNTWQHAVLPAMGHRLGIYEAPGVRDTLFEPGPAGELLRQAGVFPESPTISAAVWRKLVDHYVGEAPDRLPPQPPRQIREGVPGFRVRVPTFRTDPPLTTLVAIDTASAVIYLGDTKQDFSTLEILLRAGEPIQSIGLESAPVHLRLVADSAYVLLTGGFLPTDEPAGLLRKLFRSPGADQYAGAMRVLDGLSRPVHASYADLNADGTEDVVVSEFGFRLGRLAWYERTPDGGFRQHVLKPLPGAIRTFVRDVNDDGLPDIVALMAQGDEGVFLFVNRGGGEFREERLLRFPPSHGSTDIHLHDFDGDGHFDILYVNGDNGDYLPIPRPYHGLRVFINDGENRFTEAFFFPLHGAYRALARDFDADGDLDVAVVAFYPDYGRSPVESFVYLENRGSLTFEASTFAEASRGRWLTMDAGDLDGDGDEDLVLGSFVGFDPVGDATGLRDRWLRESPSYVVLENLTR